MKIIQRSHYLHQLINLQGTPDIKVITGMRRAGKSELLHAFIDHIKASEGTCANIIFLDLQDLDHEHLLTYNNLYDEIVNHYDSQKTNYLFIDEVQLCKDFEKAINAIHAKKLFDMYITGSNAFLMSSDLATLFTGRAIELSIFPFSFEEFCQYYDTFSIEEAFEAYVNMGGMSGSYLYKTDEDRKAYLQNVYETIVMRDLVTRHDIANMGLLKRISEFMLSNIANLTSYRKIADTLTSHGQATNHKTVANYISYMTEAFLFYRVNRYDIQGRAYLSTIEKNYLCDHGFRFAILGRTNMDYGRVYENMVAIELLRRGYEVYVGKLYQKEVDFVAMKANEKIYIQVSDDISQESTMQRELAPLLAIRDGYPKMIIANTKHACVLREGVPVIDIARWLLGDER